MGKLILLTGDEFTVKNKTRELIVSICGEDYENNPSLEIIHGDGDDRKVPDLIADLESCIATPPFLSGQKVIWLKNFNFEPFTKSKESKAVQEASGKLAEIAKSALHDDTTVVISGFSLDGRSSLSKAFQKNAEVHSFTKIDISDRKWEEAAKTIIYDCCMDKGLKISPDAAAYVTEISGPDAGRIQSEIEKVASYVFPAKSIALDDCKEICSRTPEAVAWAFSNALVQKDLNGALSSLDTLINSQNDEIGILYQVLREFQNLIKIKAAAPILGLKAGCSYATVQAKMGNPPPDVKEKLESSGVLSMHPYKALMYLTQSSRFGDSELSSILTELLRTNKAMVSGALSSKMELETLAIKICAGE